MLVSFKARLMGWNTTTNNWEMLCATKGSPALGGEPETIDASTNEDRVQVNILGRQSLDTLQWTANYSKDEIARIRKNYADGHVHHFAQWFGVDGDGADGIYEFDGTATIWAGESDSYGLVETTIAVGTTTPIYGPQKVSTDFTDPTTVLVENLYDPDNSVSITTESLPSGTMGQLYTAQVKGTSGATWSATGLPDGLTMDGVGNINGTPSTSGTFAVLVQATMTTITGTSNAYKAFTLTINA